MAAIPDAIEALRAALTAEPAQRATRARLETTRKRGQVLLQRRRWQEAAGVLAEARQIFHLLFGEGLDEAEARGLIEAAGSLYEDSAYAAVELGEDEQAFDLWAEGRARLAAVTMRLRTLSLTKAGHARLDALQSKIRAQTHRLDLVTGLARARTLEHLAKLRAELAALIATASDSITSKDALALAAPLVAAGGTIVAPIVTAAGGKLMIVTRRTRKPALAVVDLPALTAERLARLVNGDASKRRRGFIDVIAERGGAAARRRRARATASIGRQLWTLFAGELAGALAKLKVATGGRLIFMPCGLLGPLPLPLAEDASGCRLLDRYQIAYGTSLQALARAHARRKRRTEPSLAAVVNPTGDLSHFAPIEGKLVAAHFKKRRRRILDAADATPPAVLAALKGRTHWHFATHGTFSADDARRSALLMKDMAPLSVGDLIEAEDLGRPRLVVLAACNTGLYETNHTPDEFIGLPGAFMTIGADGVLGTLWPVDDHATVLLTAKFYDLHLDRGLDPPAALARAQAWLRCASTAALVRYARAAAAKAGLDAQAQHRLAAPLAAASQRFLNLMAVDKALARRAERKAGARRAAAAPPPFAEPYFWGAFIYTGIWLYCRRKRTALQLASASGRASIGIE